VLVKPLCFLVLVVILTAGLWPFHASKNEVSWSSNGHGLSFGEYGSVVSATPLKVIPFAGNSSCTLELWLKPAEGDSWGTILAFYWPESRHIPFSLRQSIGDLVLQVTNHEQTGNSKRAKIYVDDVFSHPKPIFLTISSGISGTAVYADGSLVKFSNFRVSNQDLTGQLVIGNAPATTDSWAGELKGLAVYDHQLNPAEVSAHYESWINGKQTDPAETDAAVALYSFNEGGGNIIRNQVDTGTNLIIPERFFVLHQQFLEPFWKEFHPDWSYWENIAVNIAGFVPLGFCFYAYLRQFPRIGHPAAITIAFGFAVSLTIEVLQAFLPTRNSGTTDLMTNTLGAAFGVMVYSSRSFQRLLA